MDYELRAAKARQEAQRAASGYRPVGPVPKAPRIVRERPPQPDLWRIAQRIMGAVGDCVPDGDPIDILAPFIECQGLDRWDTTKWLDKACRKHLGAKSYNQYLIDAWDGWNEICEPDQRMENPWK